MTEQTNTETPQPDNTEAATPPSTLPHWAEEIVQEVRRIGVGFEEYLSSHFEHHQRLETLIGDLRKAGIPLEAIAEHYAAHNSQLPAATPHGEATEPEAIPGVPQ